MDRSTFAILCHLLRNVAGLSSTEIVNVEEMVVMFLHVFAYDVKNHNFLGTLDGTYIKVNWPATDRPTIRMHKEEIATNTLGVCGTKEDFVYVPVDWEGSAADSGQRYHLQEWCGARNAPTNVNEYFNMKHSSTRNVIECAFSVLKSRWAILRGKSYYPLQV
ncbi:retrotransposon protein [Cucumis melo var. makuwa]|uniref:Retrotransposon protein n=1 Tax=Cucumis melo var. makuwa TaxID=1194695 RepID=A0A5D3DFN5_CUCMM|nr:retrotransposon protein [Cucumis melo var. makuwa]TYK22089.1 retrotransposon protein [Cucumis melo var. makuwa]